MQAVGGSDLETPKILTGLIIKEVEKKYADHIPDVEGVQDIVEKVLIGRRARYDRQVLHYL